MEREYMERGLNALIAFWIVGPLMVIVNLSHSLAVDTLHPGHSLTGDQTIISKNGTFELGFSSDYVGIWYANTSEKAIVWVGNRESNSAWEGVLNVSRDGYLALFDYEGVPVWSPRVRKRASRAVILDSGNFVLFRGDNLSEIIWQRFDHPGDSWLPGMKLRRGQKLTPWKNSVDPAPGLFSFQMDPAGARKFVLRWNNSVQYWESPYSDLENFGLRIEEGRSSSDSYVTYMSSMFPFMRLVLYMNGVLATEYYANHSWEKRDSLSDQCDVYNLCGVNGKCTINADEHGISVCNCLDGFGPRY